MNEFLLITGGTKGIGKAIVDIFAKNGFNVATCSRNQQDLDNLKNEITSTYGVELYGFQADLSQKREVAHFIEYVHGIGQPVDVLINNTGVFVPGSVHEEPEGQLELMVNTNLYSAYHVTRGIISQMKKRKKGHVFNICSTASITPYINGGSYCISKYAMYGMTKVLREEMKGHGIRVTAVLPGATFTSSWEGADLPQERFMKASDVAQAVYAAYQLSSQSVIEDLVIRPQLGDI